jgi:putative transposase
MAPKANAHSVYGLNYHFVWTPKCRKDFLVGEEAEAVRGILQSVARAYDMEIDTMELIEDLCMYFSLRRRDTRQLR